MRAIIGSSGRDLVLFHFNFMDLRLGLFEGSFLLGGSLVNLWLNKNNFLCTFEVTREVYLGGKDLRETFTVIKKYITKTIR